MELMARVEALLRRAGKTLGADKPLYEFGDIRVCTESQQVLKNECEIDLTPKEYALLVALLRRDGAVASRVELMQEVWGYSSAVISRTVDTHVAELRRKLEHDPARPDHIITIRKTGYRFVTEGQVR